MSTSQSDAGQKRPRDDEPTTGDTSDRIVAIPVPPPETANFIDLFARHVARGGVSFEDDIKELEHDNPSFAFLRAPWRDPVALYYRWRTYSLLQNDTMFKWREKPFKMVDSSQAVLFVPPSVPSMPPSDTSLSVASGEGNLGRHTSWSLANKIALVAADRNIVFVPLPAELLSQWKERLQNLALERRVIGRHMAFALRYNEYALDLLSVWLSHLSDFSIAQAQQWTPAEICEQRVALLFLFHDIVCNAAVEAQAAGSGPSAGPGVLGPTGRPKGSWQFTRAFDFVVPFVLDAVMATVVYLAPDVKLEGADAVLGLPEDHPAANLVHWTRWLMDNWWERNVLTLKVFRGLREQWPTLISDRDDIEL